MHHGPVVKGMRRIIIEMDEGTRHEYSVPRSVHVNVQEGERVRAGDQLIDILAAASMVRSTRTTFWPSSASRNCSATWSTRSRRSTARSPLPSTTSTSKSSAATCCGRSASRAGDTTSWRTSRSIVSASWKDEGVTPARAVAHRRNVRHQRRPASSISNCPDIARLLQPCCEEPRGWQGRGLLRRITPLIGLQARGRRR